MKDSVLHFVDTNIFLYAYSSSPDLRGAKARFLLDTLVAEGTLCTSTQVLQELLVNLLRKQSMPVDTALALIEKISVFPCFRIDLPSITQAARLSTYYKISYWDALIIQAATRLGASTIYSEDLNPGQLYEGIPLINPLT